MAKQVKEDPIEQVAKKCGIVMPIAGFDGYSANHWIDVKKIISEAASKVGYEPNLVSYTDETSVIHATIINNLYGNEIVVVDVSGKNPNVMFELGIRLAFDKPTIIIKDDRTNYIFDTGIIDHLVYPFELDYYSILDFKEKLSNKIEATYNKSKEANYRSFLKNFSDFAISSKLDKVEVSESQYILKAIQELKNDVRLLKPTLNSFIVVESEENIIRRNWTDYIKTQSPEIKYPISTDAIVDFVNWIPNKDDRSKVGSKMSLGQMKSIVNSFSA